MRAAGAERLLVADNLSDDVCCWIPLRERQDGGIVKRFDLSQEAMPYRRPISRRAGDFKGRRAGLVALWNASEIVELDLAKGMVGRKLTPAQPASAVASGARMPMRCLRYRRGWTNALCGLANPLMPVAACTCGPWERDGMAISFRVKGYFDTRLPGQSYFGAEPEALAVNADGSRPVRCQCHQRLRWL